MQGLPETKHRVLVLVAALIGVSATLVVLGDRATLTYDLGLSMLSGGIVGAIFVVAQTTLERAGAARAARAASLLQLSLSERFEASDLRGADLRAIYLPNRRFVTAVLDRAQLADGVFFFCDFRHASLRGITADRADFGGSTLQHADLSDAALGAASLFDADLRFTDLRGADLARADLSHARLGGARLDGSTMRGASLAYCDLTGADLTGCDLADADIHGVHFDARTKWPSEITPPPEPRPYEEAAHQDLGVTGWLLRRRDLRERRSSGAVHPEA